MKYKRPQPLWLTRQLYRLHRWFFFQRDHEFDALEDLFERYAEAFDNFGRLRTELSVYRAFFGIYREGIMIAFRFLVEVITK